MSSETPVQCPSRYMKQIVYWIYWLYPNFYSDLMHKHEKLDFEFDTFIVFCSFIGDALS